jgi:hypothetical protein
MTRAKLKRKELQLTKQELRFKQANRKIDALRNELEALKAASAPLDPVPASRKEPYALDA